MNFKIEDLIHFFIFGFLGLLGGTARYLHTHSKTYSLKSYASMVVTSIMVAIIVCFIVMQKTNTSGFLIAVGITSGYLGSRLFDMLAEWFLGQVEKFLNRTFDGEYHYEDYEEEIEDEVENDA